MAKLQLTEDELVFDFVNDHLNYDRKNHRGNNELIAKALGLNKGHRKILDLTAGMGIDSIFIFKLGCDVTALERSEVIFKKLEKALQEATDIFKTYPGSIQFFHADASQYLNQLTQKPEVIYYDPMYPAKPKSALPKKEMQIFRKLVGDDLDGEEVLKLALLKAEKRVVVKRPVYAEPLLKKPSYAIEGKLVRFDVYQVSVDLNIHV